MALGLCRFTNAVGGTADFEYPGPTSDMQSPASASAVNGAVYKYYAHSFDMSEWEIGTGAHDAVTGTFARTNVQANSNEDTAKIDFSNPPHVIIFDLYPTIDAYTKSESDARYVQGSRGHILGEASNNPAAAGEIGEVISSQGSSGSLTSGSTAALGNVPLTPGDWDVSAIVQFKTSGATSINDYYASLSAVAGSVVANPYGTSLALHRRFVPAQADHSDCLDIPPTQALLSAATTLYINAQAVFTGTAPTADWSIRARRAR